MAKKKQKSVGLYAFGLDSLTRFIELLNTTEYWSASLIEDRKKIGGDYRPVQKELRRLVGAWRRSGPNVKKLMDSEPRLNRIASESQPHFVPTEGNTAELAYLVIPEYSTANPLDLASELFCRFLINPFNKKIGGPCKNCRNFYVKNTERQDVYCSQRCGTAQTSKDAMQESRKKEHEKKLRDVKPQIEAWKTDKRSTDWKAWVSVNAHVSKNWLTRALQKGDLVEPVKKLRERR